MTELPDEALTLYTILRWHKDVKVPQVVLSTIIKEQAHYEADWYVRNNPASIYTMEVHAIGQVAINPASPSLPSES